ncbi:F-box domain-containing protein [Mycena kentingensis (nom. inval.)]|nr:F-box domain-containing protein [Mycena kentingensis (nom. inval.)]
MASEGFAHRLPAEIWGDIFYACAEDQDESLSDATSPQDELERLAKRYILRVSQVCSYWHRIALGTPALWCSIVAADTGLWGATGRPEADLLALVSLCLERSGAHPLQMQVAVEDDADNRSGERLFELLCQHSERWKSLYLWHNYPDFALLRSVQGRVPMLTALGLSNQHEGWAEDTPVFEVAPRLTAVTLTGMAVQTPTVPLTQLDVFGFVNLFPDDLVGPLLLMERLDAFDGELCYFQLDLESPDIVLDALPAVSSNLSMLQVTLALSLKHNAEPLWERPLLGSTFGALTLPKLKDLNLIGGTAYRSMRWDHEHFLAFVQRSMLHNTLTTLELNRILITDAQLIECLELTPAVTKLALADCAPEHKAVATDTLLRRLCGGPELGAQLLPGLDFLSLSTLLEFSDPVLLELIESRTRKRAARDYFELMVYWLPTRVRLTLSPTLRARAHELEDAEVLCFTACRDPENHSVWSYARAESLWSRS